MDAGQKYFRNYKQEQSLTQRRIVFSAIFVLCLIAVLVGRLFYLQVIEFERYQTKADQNRLKLVTEPPSRGLIYDRNGLVLADNRPIHSLTIVPERVKDMDALRDELADVIEITEEEWDDFNQRRKSYRRPYQSLTLKSHLSDKAWAKLSVDLYKWEGVQVEAQLTRYYPYGEAFAHAIGYVGRINSKDLEKVDKQRYQGSLFLGKSGIEKFYEDELHGFPGFSKVEVSARGRIMAEVERQNPVPGKAIQLHLDARLQQYAYDLLGDYTGTVIAMDPKTGGILAFVSKPGFDSNMFVRGITVKEYSALRDSPQSPLFNRALRGGYPPASTIKPFMALAGLENKLSSWTERYYASGSYQINPDGRRYRDWKKGGHGWINLERSIIESVDTYYYQLAHKMGITPIYNFLSKFGYGQKNILDLHGENGGLLPSNQWKKSRYGEPWYPGDSVNVGIGQGFMVATPIQIATATTALANRGEWLAPRMAKTINGESIIWPEDKVVSKTIKLRRDADWQRMVNAMKKVITDEKGTARRLRGAGYSIAGKTGTGQLFSLQEDEEYEADKIAKKLHDHAHFIGFAPSEKPEIAIYAIYENGGSSSKPADLSKKLFDAYILGKYPRKYNYLKVGGNE